LRHPRYVFIPKHTENFHNFNNNDLKNCHNENSDSELTNHYDPIEKSVHLTKSQHGLENLNKNDSTDDSDWKEYSEDDSESEIKNGESSKIIRSADPYFYENNSSDNCEDNKCKNSNGEQGRREEFIDLNGNGKKTTNIALKAAQEAKAAEEAQELAGKEASKQASSVS
jgi:hypothetical protein